jgi:hypothetical protein
LLLLLQLMLVLAHPKVGHTEDTRRLLLLLLLMVLVLLLLLII